MDGLNTGDEREACVGLDECDVCAGHFGGFGAGEAHFSGRRVGDISDRVDMFARGAGRDEDVFVREDFIERDVLQGAFDDGFRFGHAPFSGIAASEIAGIGIDEVHASCFEKFDVVLCRGIFVHEAVHCGGDEDWGAGSDREHGCGELVVSDSVCDFCEHVGGAWRDDDEVCF